MIRKLVENKQLVHFIFCVSKYVDKKPILLLQLEIESSSEKYKDYIKFSFVKHKELRSAVEKYPDHHVFVDEFILNMEKNRPGDISEMISQLKLATKVKLCKIKGESKVSELLQKCHKIAPNGRMDM